MISKNIKEAFFMKRISLIVLTCNILLITIPCFARKKPKKEKPPKYTISQQNDMPQEYEELHGYRPNPIVLQGVGQIMNGALSIAQDPHNRPNIGHSVAGMLYGIMTIMVEKMAHKKCDRTTLKKLKSFIQRITITKNADER